MEYNISGQIQYDKVPDSRALRSFTLKQIKRWIQNKLTGPGSIPASYRIELKREGSGHTYNCQIQVQLGNQTWIGRNYEGSLHQALIKCLNRMTPIPYAPT